MQTQTALDGRRTLERHDLQAAALVKLRLFAGFEHRQAARMFGISLRSASSSDDDRSLRANRPCERT